MNIATVGYRFGQGTSNTNALLKLPNVNIVALCDVDDSEAARKASAKLHQAVPNAAFYKDYRVMLEKQKDIDGVVVATPDHTHAVVAMAAMQLGKHVYVQKPLTHTMSEARALTEAAREVQGRHADGQPGPFRRGRPAHRGVDQRRRHRQGARGALLDEPADLGAGHAAPDRDAAGAGRPRLGSVDRAGRRCVRITRPTIRRPGARGGTSGAAPSATWPATSWTPRTQCPQARLPDQRHDAHGVQRRREQDRPLGQPREIRRRLPARDASCTSRSRRAGRTCRP